MSQQELGGFAGSFEPPAALKVVVRYSEDTFVFTRRAGQRSARWPSGDFELIRGEDYFQCSGAGESCRRYEVSTAGLSHVLILDQFLSAPAPIEMIESYSYEGERTIAGRRAHCVSGEGPQGGAPGSSSTINMEVCLDALTGQGLRQRGQRLRPRHRGGFDGRRRPDRRGFRTAVPGEGLGAVGAPL